MTEKEKMGLHVSQYLLLALSVMLTLFNSLPVADVPVEVSDGMTALMLLSAPLAMASAWGYLALSDRRRRNYLIAFGLNLLTVLFLCRAIDDICICYEYCLHGGG